MDALLPAFIAVLLAETGDRVQTQSHRLSLAVADLRPVWLALLLSGLIIFGVAASGGAYLSEMMSYRARSLLFGMALLLAGLPMLIRIKSAMPLSARNPFVTSLACLVPAQLASGSPFLIAALSARTDMPGLSVAGGYAAHIFAAALPLIGRAEWPGALPLPLLRRLAGIILVVAGLWTGLVALQLI